MRKLSVSLFPLILLACAGSDSPNAPDGTSTATPGDDGGAASPAMDGAAADRRIAVTGQVSSSTQKAFAGALVTLVDAEGLAQSAMTDGTGQFRIEGVTAPYDLVVRPPVPNSARTPFVYLGLTRASLDILDYLLPSGAPSTASTSSTGTLALSIPIPPCVGGCVVDVSSVSSDGGEGGSVYYGLPSSVTHAFTLDHEWQGTGATTGVVLDIMIADQSYEHYWYNELGSYSLAPGGTVDLGAVAPTSISTFGPLTITGDDTAVPAGWRRDMGVFINNANGTFFYGQRVASASLVTFLPNIPGSTMGLGLWATDDGATDPKTGATTDSRVSQAELSHFPLTTTSMSPKLLAPIAPLSPLAGGTFALSSKKMTWQATPGRTTQVEIVTGNSIDLFVYTDGGELSVDRLAALGVTLTAGTHSLRYSSYDATSVDSVVDPSTSANSQSSGFTSAQIEFTVTP